MSGKHSSKRKLKMGRFVLSLVLIFAVVFGVATIIKDKLPALAKSIEDLAKEEGRVGEQVPQSGSDSNTASTAGIPELPTVGNEPPEPIDEPEIPVEPEKPAEPQLTTLRIRCAGDVMAHDSQLKAAKTSDGYTFDSWFEYVKPYLEDADVTMINVETTFPGSNYHGYPTFRSPDELAQTIASLGTDIAIYANNHMLDSNQSGFERSVGLMRDLGMEVCGGYLQGEEKTWTIVEKPHRPCGQKTAYP